MQNLTINSILFALLLFLGTACQKEAVLTPDPIPQVEKMPDVLALEGEETGTEIDPEMLYWEDGVMVFRTVEYYESIVDSYVSPEGYVPEGGEPEWVEQDGVAEEAVIDYVDASDHISYGSLFENGVSEFESAYLDAILNQDRIVQIGAWLFRLDWHQRKVYVISHEIQGAYNTLLNQIGPDVSVFSMDDDVLGFLMGEGDPSLRGCGGVGGIDDDLIIFNAELGLNTYPIELKAKYQKFGIYFRLFASTRHQFSNVATDLKVEGPEAWARVRPCRRNRTHWSSPGYKNLIPSNSPAFGYTQKWVFYSGSRSLNGYHFFVSVRAELIVPPGNGRPFLATDHSQTIGRAVNYNP